MTDPIPTERVEPLAFETRRSGNHMHMLATLAEEAVAGRQRIADLLTLNRDLERSELATRTILNEEWGRKVAELEVEQVTLQFAAGQHVTDLEQRIYALTAAVWELGRCGACEDSCGRRDKSNVTAGPCEYCSGTGYHPTAQKVLGIEREGT